MPGRKRLLFDLRSDARHLLGQLKEEFELIPIAPKAAIGNPPPAANDRVMVADRKLEIPFAHFFSDHWPAVAGMIAHVEAVKPDAIVLWNTVLPAQAAAALTARKLHIPCVEINHWRISTRLVSHFEDQPAASHIVCAQEYDDFATERGTRCERLVFGQPHYDTYGPYDQAEVRRRLGLPADAKIVVKTSTWTHHLSMWSDAEYRQVHEGSMVGALSVLQEDHDDVVVVWTFRGKQRQGALPRIGHQLVRSGLAEDRLFLTDDESLDDLIRAADLVLCQKSGAAVDALMLETPSVVVDFKPNLDCWAWEEHGMTPARETGEIVPAVEDLLYDTNTRTLALDQMRDQRVYYGGTGDAGARTVQWLKEKLCAS